MGCAGSPLGGDCPVSTAQQALVGLLGVLWFLPPQGTRLGDTTCGILCFHRCVLSSWPPATCPLPLLVSTWTWLLLFVSETGQHCGKKQIELSQQPSTLSPVNFLNLASRPNFSVEFLFCFVLNFWFCCALRLWCLSNGFASERVYTLISV